MDDSPQEQVALQNAEVAARGSKKHQKGSALIGRRLRSKRPGKLGAVHVGHQIWQRLGLDEILAGAGFGHKTRILTQIMTLNRLIEPSSELAVSDWVPRSALEDILKEDFGQLNEDRLYRNMDRLYGKRAPIEAVLREKESTLFSLKESILLYDLTSTYFEGLCLSNAKAKRGYSRDSRPDCKQVVVGLVLDGDGFPKAHEIFAGNRSDSTTVADMVGVLENRPGQKEGRHRDRGPGHGQTTRTSQPSARLVITGWWPLGNPSESAILSNLKIKQAGRRSFGSLRRAMKANTKCACCSSRRTAPMAPKALPYAGAKGARRKTARSVRSRRSDFWPTLRSCASGSSQAACGHLPRFTKPSAGSKERCPRVARYYLIAYDEHQSELSCRQDQKRKQKAESLDGSYLLKSSRNDLSAEDIWRNYILLTRVEAAFRSIKSPLCERPIFHHLERRVETHIFLCVLAYHLLVCIERAFLDQGIHTSWETLKMRKSG